MEYTQLPRFNAMWRDHKCEDVDCLHLPDTAWQREANYCNPRGPLHPPSAQKYTSRAQRPPSSHPIGPTNRGSNTSTTWPPRLSTTPPYATCSSPGGTARDRGSDDQYGASWLFDSHSGMAAHPHGGNRAHHADVQPYYR
jgi:hypothetical protein